MSKYDISIIIPVYNVEDYLENCINSVVHQSKENIEIICVDDCSTDKSAEILEKLSSKDIRVRILKNDINKGRLYARKRGVMAAVGEYIMFLDGDDFYSAEACEMAYCAIKQYNTDILQFGMNVINKGNAAQFEVDSFSNFVLPYENLLFNDDVLKGCFDTEKYNYNLVNKIYKTSLCKNAFSKIDDAYYCMAEDMLAYFVLAYFAQSYMGINDKLYNYNFAIGISKPGKLDLEGLNKRCCGAESVIAIKNFLEQEGIFQNYKEIYEKMERRILSDNFDAWYYRLPFEKRKEGYDIFERHWGKDKVMLALLYDIENKQYDINQKGKAIEDRDKEIHEANVRCEQLQSDMTQKDKELTNSKIYINELNDKLLKSDMELKAIVEEKKSVIAEKENICIMYENIRKSISYRLGLAVTWIPRGIVKAIILTKNAVGRRSF